MPCHPVIPNTFPVCTQGISHDSDQSIPLQSSDYKHETKVDHPSMLIKSEHYHSSSPAAAASLFTTGSIIPLSLLSLASCFLRV